MCGGTGYGAVPKYDGGGLSPRVRGNHQVLGVIVHVAGSIPACAGEPTSAQACQQQRPVYPRVCGGTTYARCTARFGRGLSPRVRGNPLVILRPDEHDGSIPACAGEPRTRVEMPRSLKVYPRVCGGTRPCVLQISQSQGLSPRVRGNQSRTTTRTAAIRSIPACAGEPTLRNSVLSGGGVYPRVCGGTEPSMR